jgi:hypothetical protein
MTKTIERIVEDENFEVFLKELIQEHLLEGTALAIAKLCIDKGFDNLTPKQQYVIEKYVIDEHYIEECVYGDEIPLEEQAGARENGGYCSWCKKVRVDAD